MLVCVFVNWKKNKTKPVNVLRIYSRWKDAIHSECIRVQVWLECHLATLRDIKKMEHTIVRYLGGVSWRANVIGYAHEVWVVPLCQTLVVGKMQGLAVHNHARSMHYAHRIPIGSPHKQHSRHCPISLHLTYFPLSYCMCLLRPVTTACL